MNRRTFLTTAAVGGGAALLGGAFWARCAVARGQVQQELVDASDPVLTSYAQKQLSELPGRAREEMRKHFHGLCLQVSEFTDAVCKPEFAEWLANHPKTAQREQRIVELFMTHVTTPKMVLDRVHDVAETISQDLDRNWAACCDELAKQWNVKIQDRAEQLDADLMTAKLTPMIGDSIRQAADAAKRNGQPVALREVLGDVGKSALLLLPLAMAAPWVGWPLFTMLALRPVFEEWVRQASDRAATLQRTVTERLASLGNRVGLEFEKEVQVRLGDLHQWQRQAVAAAAGKQAEKLVRYL